MSEFIRPTKDRLHDLIVSKSEDVSDGYSRVHDDSPYSFCDSEFKGILRVAGRDACVPSSAWPHALACQFAIVGGAAFLPHNRFEIESLIMLLVKNDL